MKSYSEFMPAGVPVKLTIGGRLLYIQRSSGGAVLDITFHSGAGTQGVVGVGKGFKAGPVGGFDTITFKASQDSTVEFIVTDGDVSAQFDDASTIIGNDDGQAVPIRMKAGDRLPVDLSGGTINLTAAGVVLNNDNTKPVPIQRQALATLVDLNAVVVGTAAAALVSDNTLKRLIVRNASLTQTVAIGGATVTMAKAAIVLQPGDSWIEEDAAGAAWYAIADAAAADVRLLGIK